MPILPGCCLTLSFALGREGEAYSRLEALTLRQMDLDEQKQDEDREKERLRAQHPPPPPREQDRESICEVRVRGHGLKAADRSFVLTPKSSRERAPELMQVSSTNSDRGEKAGDTQIPGMLFVPPKPSSASKASATAHATRQPLASSGNSHSLLGSLSSSLFKRSRPQMAHSVP
jgi:hypothetical protein